MDADFLAPRIADTAALCERTQTPRYLGFLTPAEAAIAERQLHRFAGRTVFFGGYDSAERVFLGCLPEWCETPDFPIAALTVLSRPCDTFGHRDVLGALMSLGLKRETIGDILIESGRTVLFIQRDLANYICEQLEKIAAVGVHVEQGAAFPLPQMSARIAKTDTVASLRLDCVVAALAGTSRSAAACLIEDLAVSVNGMARAKPTAAVAAGDRISIRKHGKFVIDKADEVSKKGRIILNYSQYS